MKKKVLTISLSMAMVLGLAGIVSANTIGNNGTNMQPKASNAQAYMAENNNVTSTEAEQEETSQADQTVPSETNNYDQMRNSNASMNEQMQNMSANAQMQTMPNNTQMQNMPMNTQMNEQMNSQHTQAMTGTNTSNNSKASQQSAQKSSSNNRMGSMGGMGR